MFFNKYSMHEILPDFFMFSIYYFMASANNVVFSLVKIYNQELKYKNFFKKVL